MSIFHGLKLNSRTLFERCLPAQPCVLCGAESRDGLWCLACEASLPYLTAACCPVCALPNAGGDVCGQCLKKRPQFAHTVAVFSYQFPVDKLIQEFKYRHHFALANAFAEQLARCITVRPDCLVAMPLHPTRLRERGFNQSHELAKCLAQRLDIPLLPHACQRVRDTAPQASLKWKERSKNIRHAFTCNEEVRGKHVAVVDDVITSGASLNELATALRKAGASEVSNWVVARTVRRG